MSCQNSENQLNCAHFNNCSGCSISSILPLPDSCQKAKTFFLKEFNYELFIETGSIHGWRCRAKLAVRRGDVKGDRVKIGLFKQNSHYVIPIPECRVHHPQINQAIQELKIALDQSDLTVYQETSHQGDLKYVQCIVERASKAVQLSLVLNVQSKDTPCVQKWTRFGEYLYKNGNIWHSIWLNFQTARTNTIFGNEWLKVMGKDWVWENIQNQSIAFGPANFGQSNLDMFEKLLVTIKQWILPNVRLLELYAGNGVVGISLADVCQSIDCVEVNPYAKPCFEASLKQLNPQVAHKMTFHVLSADQAGLLLQQADVCIVDPPRKGLDLVTCNQLKTSNSIKELIYIACGRQAFERDAQKLVQHGWKLKQARGFLFFPGSDHIEILAHFIK